MPLIKTRIEFGATPKKLSELNALWKSVDPQAAERAQRRFAAGGAVLGASLISFAIWTTLEWGAPTFSLFVGLLLAFLGALLVASKGDMTTAWAVTSEGLWTGNSASGQGFVLLFDEMAYATLRSDEGRTWVSLQDRRPISPYGGALGIPIWDPDEAGAAAFEKAARERGLAVGHAPARASGAGTLGDRPKP